MFKFAEGDKKPKACRLKWFSKNGKPELRWAAVSFPDLGKTGRTAGKASGLPSITLVGRPSMIL